MGLLNSRNLRKAKELIDKNRHKAGDLVGKAGDTLDKVSKGKTSNITAKATEAADKFADGAKTRHDFGDPSGDHDGMPADTGLDGVSQAEANAAGVAAANAMTNMANAATNFLNTAAAQAQSVAAQQGATGDGADAADGVSDDPSSPPPLPG